MRLDESNTSSRVFADPLALGCCLWKVSIRSWQWVRYSAGCQGKWVLGYPTHLILYCSFPHWTRKLSTSSTSHSSTSSITLGRGGSGSFWTSKWVLSMHMVLQNLCTSYLCGEASCWGWLRVLVELGSSLYFYSTTAVLIYRWSSRWERNTT